MSLRTKLSAMVRELELFEYPEDDSHVDHLGTRQITVRENVTKHLYPAAATVISDLKKEMEILSTEARNFHFPTIKNMNRYPVHSGGCAFKVRNLNMEGDDEHPPEVPIGTDEEGPYLWGYCFNSFNNVMADGNIYNSPKFDSDETMRTSVCVLITNDWLITQSGSVYNYQVK
jgi:hypothetical protein